ASASDVLLGFWDTHTGGRLTTPRPAYSEPVLSLAVSRDGHWLAQGGYPILRLWDARDRAEVATVDLGSVNDLSFSRDGTILAATLTDRAFAGGLELLSVPALKILRSVAVPAGTWGRFSPDGRSLIYGDHEGRIW